MQIDNHKAVKPAYMQTKLVKKLKLSIFKSNLKICCLSKTTTLQSLNMPLTKLLLNLTI